MKKGQEIVLVFIALIAVIGLVVVTVSFVNFPFKIDYIPEEIYSVNYNNYTDTGYWERAGVDCMGDRFAFAKDRFWGSKLTVVDSRGEILSFKGVGAPFRLQENGIAFSKKERLFFRDNRSGKKIKIADLVERFLVYQDQVVYLTVDTWSDWRELEPNRLHVYDISKRESRCLQEDVETFFIHRDTLFAVKGDDTLWKLSLVDGTAEEIMKLPIKAYPYTILPQGDHVVFDGTHDLYVLNINTGEIRTVSFWSEESAHRIFDFICDEEQIFVSVQGQHYNGSIVNRVDSENTGVWRIDPETLEKEKIVSEAFEDLYLFEGDTLFGIENKKAYRIDIQAKEFVKIAG